MRFGPSSPALSGVPPLSTLSGATQTVTPSYGLAPLQGFLPKVSLVISRREHLLQGFPGRLAYSFQRSPHTPEGPTLRVKVRVQGFSPSSRLPPPPALRVYFTPLTPFGFPLQGFPLPRSSMSSSLTPCRLAVLQRLRSRILGRGTSGAHPHNPRSGVSAFCRLHGLAPLESPFRARPQLSCLAGRAPLGFFPLQGLPFRGDATALHRHSSRVLEPASAPPGCPRGPTASCTAEYHSPRQ
jgi:hypothetical protein